MRLTKTILAATALSIFATPAMAQDAEEPRTTYAVTALDLADGADDRWMELRTTMIDAARERAGLPADTIHWVMLNPDWDIIIVSEMPDGMAAFDTHGTDSTRAFVAALTELAGGESELEAMREEMDGLVDNSMTVYTHTHP